MNAFNQAQAEQAREAIEIFNRATQESDMGGRVNYRELGESLVQHLSNTLYALYDASARGYDLALSDMQDAGHLDMSAYEDYSTFHNPFRPFA